MIAENRIEGAFLEDLCFHAQQAAEKAIKGLLIHLGTRFRPVHNLALLISQVEKAGRTLPADLQRVVRLTEYAVAARYPGAFEGVTEDDWREALSLARGVVEWVAPLVSEGR